jgi:hypothetical protein
VVAAVTIRKRNPTPREELDFYRTPRECVDALLTAETIDGPVWECACGDGAISAVLRSAGHEVITTDVQDRGYGEVDAVANFFDERELRAPVILTNPPYLLAERFVDHALSLQPDKLILLLRLSWLEGESRRRGIFSRQPPHRVWVLSSRPTLWNGSVAGGRDTGGAISYAWYVWDALAPPGTVLGWLKRPAPPTGIQGALWRQDLARKRLEIALQAGLTGFTTRGDG